MSYKLADHAEPVGFDVFLYCRANIANRISNLRLLDPLVQRCFRYLEQLLLSGGSDNSTGTVIAESP